MIDYNKDQDPYSRARDCPTREIVRCEKKKITCEKKSQKVGIPGIPETLKDQFGIIDLAAYFGQIDLAAPLPLDSLLLLKSDFYS